MASAQSKIFNIVLRFVNKKGLLKRQFTRGVFDAFTTPVPVGRILNTSDVHQYQIGKHNVFRFTPKKQATEKHILYLHGGAYVTSFVKPHWFFLEKLIVHARCTITAPDYPLAPGYTYKEVFNMLIPLYKNLLATVHPNDLILMGDSAGGGMALSLAQRFKIENIPQPNQIILLSPWLDITLSNPEILKLDSIDPFTGIDGLLLAGKVYAGGDDPKNYLLSPINGPLDELGMISIFIGTKEILVADTRKLKAQMDAKGVVMNYREYKDMVHVWMLLDFPESRKVREEIVNLINPAQSNRIV